MNQSVSKRQQAEDDIYDTVNVLKEKHVSNFSMPRLLLWARMIFSGNHESTDDPPKVSAITSITLKKERSSLADAISNAVSTFAQVLKPQVSVSAANNSVVVNQTKSLSTGIEISPLYSAEL